MMDKPLMIGIGELLWDLFPGGKKPGGATANFAWHAGQLGGRGLMISAVGKDAAGNEILDLFEKNGLNTAFIAQLEQFPTGSVEVKLDSMGIPSYQIHTGVAWDNIEFTPESEQIVEQASALCFGSLAQRSEASFCSIQKALDAAPESCLKVFDVNLRQRYYSKKVIEKSLEKADVLKLNEDELPIIDNVFGIRGSEEKQLDKLLADFNLKYIALTKGGEGSLLVSVNEQSWLSSPKVKIADTVGAGDSFTAAMTVGLLKKQPLKNVHQLAVDVSAFVCTQAGAMPVLPSEFGNRPL